MTRAAPAALLLAEVLALLDQPLVLHFQQPRTRPRSGSQAPVQIEHLRASVSGAIATMPSMINVLVSTTVTQGAAPGDFCWVPEGELVARYGMVCASERPDGSGCGCGRSFAGLTTHKATTTAMVAEVDLTEVAWRAALHQTLVDTGWAQWSTADELTEWIDELVAIDLRSAAQMAPGTILGRLAYNEPDGTIQDMFLDRSALRSS